MPARKATRQVFRAGAPVDRAAKAFVPRHRVLDELKRLMLPTGCPGLVLYGRWRSGKSTLLRNLDGFLPPNVRPVVTSLLNPVAYLSLPGLVGVLVRGITTALPGDDAVDDGIDDLPGLFAFLAEVNARLDREGLRLFLVLDEYEQLDHQIGKGVFPEDLLATVRESIRTHPRIIWAFAGSHEISQLGNAPWTSYLVNARTVEVPPFTPAETRLLLTEPLAHSTLWAADDSARPRFAPKLWGDGGIERIHVEAGGWPNLVQLVAATVVELLNDEDRPRADAELLERALDKAVIRGAAFFELLHCESTLPGEWDYLVAFGVQDRQPPPGDQAVAHSLRRRLLVVEDGGAWRLRVPLMARWLRQ